MAPSPVVLLLLMAALSLGGPAFAQPTTENPAPAEEAVGPEKPPVVTPPPLQGPPSPYRGPMPALPGWQSPIPAPQGPMPPGQPLYPGSQLPAPGLPAGVGLPPPATPTAPGGQPAWTPPPPPAPSQTYFPAGLPDWVPIPTTARFEFHPSVWLSEEYTDNFHLTATNPQENWRSTLGAGFSLLINDVKARGYLSTGLSASWDTTEGGQFTLFPSFVGGVTYTVDPRLSFTLSDSLTRSDAYSRSDRFGVRGAERALFASNVFSASMNWMIDRVQTTAFYTNSLFFGDNDTMTNTLGVNVGVPVGLDTTVSAGYQFWVSDTAGDSAQDDSNVGNTFFASVSRRVGQYGSAGISGSYSLQSLDNARIWNVSLFGTYGLPTGFSVSASAGYGRATSDNGVDEGRPTTNTTISYSVGRLTARVWAYADFQPSFVLGENLGVLFNKGAGAGLSIAFSPLMAGGLYGSWSQTSPTGIGNNSSTSATNTYSFGANATWGPLAASTNVSFSDSVVLGSPDAPQFGNDQVTVNAALSWRILSFLSASASYEYLRRVDAGTQGGTVRENLATVTLTAAF